MIVSDGGQSRRTELTLSASAPGLGVMMAVTTISDILWLNKLDLGNWREQDSSKRCRTKPLKLKATMSEQLVRPRAGCAQPDKSPRLEAKTQPSPNTSLPNAQVRMSGCFPCSSANAVPTAAPTTSALTTPPDRHRAAPLHRCTATPRSSAPRSSAPTWRSHQALFQRSDARLSAYQSIAPRHRCRYLSRPWCITSTTGAAAGPPPAYLQAPAQRDSAVRFSKSSAASVPFAARAARRRSPKDSHPK